ncbi:hypothetical protein K474DRAFT_232465 [Panus rudis PR-1116 ss-1]|nr:hypothetical protein K474DRAFT_232465 [Panus rudis PR-1116 ss-1]
MSSLPSLDEISASSPAADSPLATALSVFFEPSPILLNELVPQIASELDQTEISSYNDLIDLSLNIISSSWDVTLKSQFISGHPRIGEVKNLSHLSTKEQATVATPPEVLARLEELNRLYEKKYPGLRYITFVNGQSRAMIVEEMEEFLGVGKGAVNLEEVEEVPNGSAEWRDELERAVVDVGRIARSRLKTLGVQ